MKKTVLSLLGALLLHPAAVADGTPERPFRHDELVVYHTDGSVSMFRNALIDKIEYSRADLDGILHDDYVTQEIWTPDSVYRTPLAEVERISFHKPETEYQPGVRLLEGEVRNYIAAVDYDALTVTLAAGCPAALIPDLGEVVFTNTTDGLLPHPFGGTVDKVTPAGGGYLLECVPCAITDVYKTLYTTFAIGEEENQDPALKASLRDFGYPVGESVFDGPIDMEWSPEFTIPDFKIPTELTRPPLAHNDNGIRLKLEGEASGRAVGFIALRYNTGIGLPLLCDFSFVWAPKIEGDISLDIFAGFEKSSKVHLFKRQFPLGTSGMFIEPDVYVELKGSGELALGATVHHSGKMLLSLTGGSSPAVKKEMLYTDFKWGPWDVGYITGSLEAKLHLGVDCNLFWLSKHLNRIGTHASSGLKLEAEINFDKLLENALASTRDYENVKDIVNTTVSFDSEVSLEGGLFYIRKEGTDGRELDDYTPLLAFEIPLYQSTVPFFECGMLPDFSEPDCQTDKNGVLRTSVDLSGPTMLPVKTGIRLWDKDMNPMETIGRTDKWGGVISAGPHPADDTFSSEFKTRLRPGRKYTVTPYVSLFGWDIAASPAKEVTVDMEITTGDAAGIKHDKATLSGYTDGFGYHTESASAGFEYGLSASSLTQKAVSPATSNGNFSTQLTGLEPATTYYYRACLTLDGETFRGATKSFKTAALPPDAVDLGLSVMWAKANVGAVNPWERGGLYGWGDPTGTNTTSAVFSDGDVWISGLYGGSNPPAQISGTSLDIATALAGNGWRLPTEAEIVELLDECDWEYTSLNGTWGMNVTGPSGKSIFLPLTGYRFDQTVSNEDCGYYWSGTSNTEQKRNAYHLEFNSSYSDYSSYARYIGMAVRAVIDTDK